MDAAHRPGRAARHRRRRTVGGGAVSQHGPAPPQARPRELFNLDQTIFFYELTSTYFEGQALNNPSAKRGYSRDKRPDCKQVVVGLVINRDGFPQAHEIFDGNTQDRATLPAMLDALEARVGGFRRGQMVVVDRGMAFEENLEELRSRGLRYLVASRHSERTRWLAEFETLEGFDEVIRIPCRAIPDRKRPRSKSSSSAPRMKHSSCASAKGESKRTAPSATSTSGVY